MRVSNSDANLTMHRLIGRLAARARDPHRAAHMCHGPKTWRNGRVFEGAFEVQPPASPEDVRAAEARLGFPLPRS